MGDFRFSLRHGDFKPTNDDDIALYEPFLIGPDSSYNYYLGVKVPKPTNSSIYEYRFTKLIEKSNFPDASYLLPDNQPEEE